MFIKLVFFENAHMPLFYLAYLEEDGLNNSTVLSLLLVHHRVEEVLGGDPGVGQSLVPADQPQEDVW